MSSLTYFSLNADMLAIVGAAGTSSTVPIRGKVTFTPMIKSGDALVLTTLSPRPGLVSPSPVTGVIGSDGQLGFGGSGVRLIADTAVLGLTSPLFYTVDFVGLTVNGQPRQLTSFNFQASQSDTPINLANVARVPGQPASGVVNTPLPNRVRLNGSNQVVFSANGVDLPDPLPIEGFDADLAAIAALAPADGDVIQRVSGSWLNRTVAQLKSALSLALVDNTSDASKPVSTAQQTALNGKMSPLTAVADVTINTNPTVGVITPYNTSTASLTGTLPALSGLNVGDRTGFKKYLPTGTLDLGYTVTVSCAGADTFYGGGTTAVLKLAGEFRELMVISISGTKYFTTVSALNPLTASDNRYSDLAPVGNGPFNGVITKLNNGRSPILHSLGDSTGAGSVSSASGWFGYIGDKLGDYYDANVWIRWWSSLYDPSWTFPVARRVSSQGERTAAAARCTFRAPSIKTDPEFFTKITPTSWHPTFKTVLSKWDYASNKRGIAFNLGDGSTAGKLSMSWSPDGTSAAAKTATSTAGVPFTDGSPGWIRYRLDVDNGAAGWSAYFYTSPDGIAWTQLGATVTGSGVTSVFDNVDVPYMLGLAFSTDLSDLFSGTYTMTHLADGFAPSITTVRPSVVPVLPEHWEQQVTGTNPSPTEVSTNLVSGGPLIMLMSGAIGGTDLTYADDNTRRPMLLASPNIDVIFINYGHNDNVSNPRTFATDYLTLIRHIQNWRPGVPIIANTENPTRVADPWQNQKRAARVSAMASALGGVAGVTVLDTRRAYTDLSTMVLAPADPGSGGGLHPTDPGYYEQGRWLLNRLAPKTAL